MKIVDQKFQEISKTGNESEDFYNETTPFWKATLEPEIIEVC